MPEMNRVASSHVWETGYDPAAQELHVRYIPSVKNPEGKMVAWSGVPPETAIQILHAPSVGSALRTLIYGKFEQI